MNWTRQSGALKTMVFITKQKRVFRDKIKNALSQGLRELNLVQNNSAVEDNRRVDGWTLRPVIRFYMHTHKYAKVHNNPLILYLALCQKSVWRWGSYFDTWKVDPCCLLQKFASCQNKLLCYNDQVTALSVAELMISIEQVFFEKKISGSRIEFSLIFPKEREISGKEELARKQKTLFRFAHINRICPRLNFNLSLIIILLVITVLRSLWSATQSSMQIVFIVFLAGFISKSCYFGLAMTEF